jgi:glucose/arabinose dehydrogenase
MQRITQPRKSAFFVAGFISVILGLSACSEILPVGGVSTGLQPDSAIVLSPTPFVPQPTIASTGQPLAMDVSQIPDSAKYQWTVVFSGFNKPLDLASPPGDAGKIVVVEQAGVISLIQDGVRAAQPYLDIHERVGSEGSEQGLLGIAFHPNYAKNRFFYVNYTDLNGNTVIARFSASATGESADPQSEKKLIQVNQPYPNHNGGGLAFGPDGFLYIGLGDGGSAGDPQNNAQNVNTLLGKLLRIDVSNPDYSNPQDNPFAKGGGSPEIWAYGLRNPWRFSFDSSNGALYIGDVGQNIWEEVDYLPAGTPGGVNFGWSQMEGNHPYRDLGVSSTNLVPPISEYDHNSGCSITGGYVYRGKALPEWHGVYLFSDYCRGTIWGLLQSASGNSVKVVAKINGNISSFGVDSSGEIYALEHTKGDIYKLTSLQ